MSLARSLLGGALAMGMAGPVFAHDGVHHETKLDAARNATETWRRCRIRRDSRMWSEAIIG